MGPAFVILFFLLIAAVFGGAWVLSLILYLIGRKRNMPVLKWFGLLPLFGLTIIAIAIACMFTYGVIRSYVPRFVYTDTFHEQPTDDVSELKSDVFGFADSAHTYLQFKASLETFDRICPDHLMSMTFEKFDNEISTAGANMPDWWNTLSTNIVHIRVFQPEYGKGRHFASETEFMTYDNSNATIQYFYQGID